MLSYSVFHRRTLLTVTAGLLSLGQMWSQTLSLENLSAFKPSGPNWRVAGGVSADFNVKDHLIAAPGTGILANIPSDPKQAKDIYTLLEHGDADIELEFMMAKASNSGIYLQGRYEIQLLDSWGKKNASAGDCGGIYERWDEKRTDGRKGYEGYAPRTNASRAPGVWQKLRISFQAPRFDATGKKTANARIIRVQLNDITIHENVELTGPTRGGMNDNEVPRGPLRIQGDHGPVAFRNLTFKLFDTPNPVLRDIRYIVHDGRVIKETPLKSLKTAKEGKGGLIDNNVSHLTNNYVLGFSGKIVIPTPGAYRFSGVFDGGYGNLVIHNQTLFPFAWARDTKEVELPAGELPFEYYYSKVNEGTRPSLGLTVEGPGIRPVDLHEKGSVNLQSGTTNPIFLGPVRETAIHRSFIDFKGQRLPYGISVGDISGINYAFNLANGSMIRAWRGDFLNVTPMWNSRGNGTSTPLGSVLELNAEPQIALIGGKKPENYVFKGYKVNTNNDPTFLYEWNQVLFEDIVTPDNEKKYLNRTVRAIAKGTAFTFSLAQGDKIEALSNGTFLVDGIFYIQVTQGGKPVIADQGGRKTLTVPVNETLSYAVIW